MARFDLNDYETVAERIKRFYKDYSNGAIRTDLIKADGEIGKTRWVVKASVYGDMNDDYPIGTGYAFEVDGSGMANNTSALENGECVPLTVPALTRSGWKYFHQLKIGEELLTYDTGTESMVWSPVLKVSKFDKTALRKIGNSRFSATCTPDHKWVIGGALVPWDERDKNGRIRLSAPVASRGGDYVAAARLGWLFGDATLKRVGDGLVSGATITQSKVENFEILNNLFGEPVLKSGPSVREWDDGTVSTVKENYAWNVSPDVVRDTLGKFGVNSEADLVQAVLGMTFDEVEAFLEMMMRSDGAGRVYSKTSYPLAAAVQLAMFITGHATGTISERAGNYMTTKPCYTVSMHKVAEKYLSEFEDVPVPPQEVWCPTTEHGTWVGLFDGRPAITGNTSAIGRALANANYSGDKRASREEMAKVVARDAALERISSAKTVEELSAIYAEAAQAGWLDTDVQQALTSRKNSLNES